MEYRGFVITINKKSGAGVTVFTPNQLFEGEFSTEKEAEEYIDQLLDEEYLEDN